MTQHKCGTCRYFEEGGFAGSGRCSHPLRKNIQQMVLVRRSELACRSDWANDLWEPRQDVEPVSIASSQRYTTEAGSAEDRRQYTDRVTAVTVAPSRTVADESSRVSARLESTRPVDEPRVESIGPLDDDADADEPAPSSTRPQAQSRPERSSDEDERPRIDVRRELLQSSPSPERAERPVTQPTERPSSRSERDSDREPAAQQPRRGEFDSRSWGLPARDVAASRPRESETVRNSPDIQYPELPARRSSGEEPATRFGASPMRSAEPRPAEAERPSRGPVTEKSASGSLPQGRSGWTEPFAVTTPAVPPAVQTPARSEATQVEEDEPRVIEPVPATPVTPPVSARQSTMKECCGTCRDFRPSEGGERGWCNNPYAFDHRQMVERNDLACRSTIGTWWIASDDWWMQRADITHHGRPTPIIDDLLRQLLNSRAQRRASRG